MCLSYGGVPSIAKEQDDLLLIFKFNFVTSDCDERLLIYRINLSLFLCSTYGGVWGHGGKGLCIIECVLCRSEWQLHISPVFPPKRNPCY
jgi:hypothetical protein